MWKIKNYTFDIIDVTIMTSFGEKVLQITDLDLESTHRYPRTTRRELVCSLVFFGPGTVWPFRTSDSGPVQLRSSDSKILPRTVSPGPWIPGLHSNICLLSQSRMSSVILLMQCYLSDFFNPSDDWF